MRLGHCNELRSREDYAGRPVLFSAVWVIGRDLVEREVPWAWTKGNQATRQKRERKATCRSLRERIESIEVVIIPHCWAIEEPVRAKSPVTATGGRQRH